MKKKISVICPTHQRRALQKRFANSVFGTSADPSTIEIVFGIDNNDDVALETAEQLKEQFGKNSILVCKVEPNVEKLATIVNQCTKMATGEILCNAADDVEFCADGWDQCVLQEFERYDDKIMLLWSDDGLWGGQLASHYFLHKNWVNCIGYAQPEIFYADWTDHWVQNLATTLGRGVLIRDRSRLFLRHRHAEFGGMEKDETYHKVKARRERNVEQNLTANSPQFENLFLSEVSKLQNFINEYKKT